MSHRGRFVSDGSGVQRTFRCACFLAQQSGPQPLQRVQFPTAMFGSPPPAMPVAAASASKQQRHPMALQAAAQDRSRSPMGHGCSPAGHIHGHNAAAARAVGADAPLAGGQPYAWTTGDKALDSWVLSLRLETSLLQRLCTVTHLQDRRDIVQACRDSLSRIRCMGAFMNGCITKTLAAQKSCEGRPRLTTQQLAAAGAVASSPRPSFPAGMGDEEQAAKLPYHEQPSGPQAGGRSGSGHPKISANSADACPGNDDAIGWQAWAVDALNKADQKSQFMREVLAVLDSSDAGGIAALPGQWSFTLGCAVALLARDGQSPKATAPLLLRSYAQTLGKPSTVSSAVSSAGSSHKFVIVHYGALCGMSHAAFKAALTTVLTGSHGFHIELYEVHSFPACPTSHAVEKHCLTNLGFRVNLMEDTTHWPSLCRDRKQHWASKGVRLLVLYAVDARSSHPVFQADTIMSKQTLHSPANAEFWRLLAGLKYLSTEFGSSTMSMLTWNAAEWEYMAGDALAKWLGPALTADPFRYKCPQSSLTFTAHPPMQHVTGKCAGADANSTAEGWCWLPAVQKQPRAELRHGPWSPSVLRVFDVVVFQERELLPAEQQVLRSCQRIHAESGQIRLMDVPRVCAFFGVQHSAVGHALTHQLPCLGSILRTTGTACEPTSELAVECGAERWCMNCEQALRLLWCSPPIGLLCDYMASWMNAVLEEGDDKTSGATNLSWQSLPDHICGAACAGVAEAAATCKSPEEAAGIQGSGEVTGRG